MLLTFCLPLAPLCSEYCNNISESKFGLAQVNFVILWHILAKPLNALE